MKGMPCAGARTGFARRAKADAGRFDKLSCVVAQQLAMGDDMNYRAHLFIGVACGAVAAYLLRLGLPDAAVFCAVSALSSLLPDLDIRNSKASQAAYAVALIAVLAAAYSVSFAKGGGLGDFAFSFFAISGVLLAVDLIFRPLHRGMMHGAPFAIVAAAACYAFFGALAAGAFLLGYCSHLAADRLS